MRRGLRTAFFAGAVLALLCLGLSLFMPSLIARNYDRKGLEGLKAKAREVRREFAAVLTSHDRMLARLRGAPPSGKEDRLFAFLKGLGLRTETEGAACFGPDGRLILWLGNVVDLDAHIRPGDLGSFSVRKAPFLVRDKASFFLVSIETAPDGGHLALFRLLAFIPQFQSSYLKESHFLGRKLLKSYHIDYWSFHEDVSGFEKIFAKHDDEFVGQPRQMNEIRTLYFPLRGPDKRILATVTLSSRSLTERLTVFRENIFFGFYALLILSLVSLLVFLATSPGFFREGDPPKALLIIAALAGIRLLFFPFSRLERVQSLSVFSPRGAGFLSLGDLTRSPADILLTALAAALLAGVLAVLAQPLFRTGKRNTPRPLSIAMSAASLAAAVFLMSVFQAVVRRLIFNSNISLLSFRPEASFLFLHLALLFFLATLLTVLIVVLRAAAVHAPGPGLSFILAVPAFAAFIILSREPFSPFSTAVRASVLALVLILAHSPVTMKKKEVFFLGFFLGTIFLTQSIDRASAIRTRSLIQNFLRNAVLSQEQWGRFLVEESLPEIDKRSVSIRSFLKEPGSPDFAHTLWDKTLAAKFNWYSSLEVLDAEGNALSRFSLNVPKLYSRELSLPPSLTWTVSRRSITSLGREKDFFVGYKDWFEGSLYFGRTLFFLSLDPDMLPFLYSANPYFELLRAGPVPSLNAVDFGLAIFDTEGRLLFNPQRISSGIPTDVLTRLGTPGAALWGGFTSKSRAYDSYYFRHGKRVFSLFTPRKTYRTYAVEFLKLFFLDLILALVLALPAALVRRRRPFRNVFWSFSNRVYAAFFAVALVPLLLLTFFTRNLFDRIFADRFVEEAATHASFARSILEDFIYIQAEDPAGLPSPPEDMVLWVSATLSNDVNLYRDARLLSSSRREFFDAGLLPELLDGEIYYRLRREKAPFWTQRKRIGGYSFQTLTVPYDFRGSTFLVSLPFPFEKQEAARAAGELVEFLFLISIFFAGLVFLFARAIRVMIVVPVRKLLAGTHEVSLGNLEVTIDHPSQDEMKTLVDGFNAMVRSLKAHQQELAEMGKKVAWAEMARKVAHEIKNPLTPIQLSAEHILKVYEDRGGDFGKALKESISYIIGEVENLRRISQEFMEIARDTTLRKESCDLKEVLDGTLAPYKKLLASRIRFRETYEGADFSCMADAAKLGTAFRNIVINAIEAVKETGEITVLVRRGDQGLTVSIRDSGPGMSREVLDKIFEPYFSTKTSGTGLGLPIAKKIIEDHGGSVRVVSGIGRGTTVTVDLP